MVFHKEQREICQQALDTYGIDKQLDIAIEEMAELTRAIIKHRRYASRETYENLCEETADVAIMLEQIFLSTKGADIAKYGIAKIARLKQRLTAENCDINKHIESCEDCGFCKVGTEKTHLRCAKCGKPITKEELRTGCRACNPEVMSRYEYLKGLPIEKMAAVIAGMIILNVVSVTGEPINATIKKMYTKQVVEWLLGEVEDNGKENN